MFEFSRRLGPRVIALDSFKGIRNKRNPRRQGRTVSGLTMMIAFANDGNGRRYSPHEDYTIDIPQREPRR